MFRDLRLALRMLLHAKGWTAVIIISLALGIGANTAIFSAANGLLLKKLSVNDPDTLVRLKWAGRNDMVTDSSDYGNSLRDAAGLDVRATFSYAMYQQFRADNETMTDLFACAPAGRVNLAVNGQAEIAQAFLVSGNYFQVLGVSATRGRTILAEDDNAAAPPVAVLSDGYWRTRFGGDPAAIGRTVHINNVAVTVVGVIERAFNGVQLPLAQPPDVTVPLALDARLFTSSNPAWAGRLRGPTAWWLQVMGRLKPGVTPAQVQANLEGVFRATARAGLDSYLAGLSEAARASTRNRSRSQIPYLRASSGSRGIYDTSNMERRAAGMLSAVTALVLLIVCANVANLLLSRATARQKEISVRLSMGATRGRLVRQLLTESLVLAVIGGALGVVVGYWGKQLIPDVGHAPLLEWRVLAFVAAVTTATGVIFGIAPALRSTRVNVSAALKASSRSVASRNVLSKFLLVVQVAITLVLLVGTGLLLRTLQNLRSVDVGFNTQNLVLFRVNPQLNGYDQPRTQQFYQEATERLQTMAGVRGVTLSQPALLVGSTSLTDFFVHGRSDAPGTPDNIYAMSVAPNFFEVMGIPLLVGRGFTERDTVPKAPRVAIVNEAAVRKYFPSETPIGRRFGSTAETSDQIEIVGVLKDARYNSVRETAPPTMYSPLVAGRASGPWIAVRTSGDASAAIAGIRGLLRQIDPGVPMLNVYTQAEQVEQRYAMERFFAHAYTLFGVLALVVASIGLFGLMSYSVERRTHELGIRMALGAQRATVLGQVMREAMILVAAGVVLGLAGALGATRVIASLLFGIERYDLATTAAAVAILIAVAALAGYLPARRAARVDPMVALRYE